MAKLTEARLRAWVCSGKPIAGRSDGGGLTFTLSRGRTASWVFRYRIGGRPRELTLGNYPDISLKDARMAATQARAKVDKLVDVAAEKRREKSAVGQPGTVAELADNFIAQGIRPKYRDPKRVENLFKRDVVPVIGSIPVRDVSASDIDRLLRRIVNDERPTTANDALRLVRQMFAFARKRGLVDANPAADFNLGDAGGQEKARQRRLSRQEIGTLFTAIRNAGSKFARENELAVKLLLALGVRKMELLAARWDEFDLEGGIWRLPGKRTKTGASQEIPLAAPVLAWLRELRIRAAGSYYVFPARRASKRFAHVSPDTLNFALNSLTHGLDPFTVHDFRRTTRTLLASLGIASDVAERCLNHKLRGIEGIYNRHDYFEERKAALAQLGALLEALDRGETFNVVPLRSERAA